MRDANKEAALERRHRRVGEFLESLGQIGGLGGLQEGALVDFRVRLPTEEEPAALLIVRAAGAEGRVIAFVGAYGVIDVLLAWRARSEVGRMKWREDVPWSER